MRCGTNTRLSPHTCTSLYSKTNTYYTPMQHAVLLSVFGSRRLEQSSRMLNGIQSSRATDSPNVTLRPEFNSTPIASPWFNLGEVFFGVMSNLGCYLANISSIIFRFVCLFSPLCSLVNSFKWEKYPSSELVVLGI